MRSELKEFESLNKDLTKKLQAAVKISHYIKILLDGQQSRLQNTDIEDRQPKRLRHSKE